MPVIVTDDDVLAQIALNDGQAAAVDASLKSLGAKVPAYVSANWASWYKGYQAWATTAKARLSGGFFFGAWFGVPELGDQAAAKATDLNGWQATVNEIANNQTIVLPTPATAEQAAAANATIPGLNDGGLGGAVSAGATGIALGLLAALFVVVLVKK
jgi:hypothetical protein